MDQAAVIGGVRSENRITGRHHQNHVPGINQDGGQNGKRRLAADGVQYFGFGIDAAHAANSLQITGRRFLQNGVSVVGVAAVFGAAGFFAQFRDGFGAGHFVRLAHAQVNDFRAGMSGEGGPFGALDFLELVNGGGFPVILPADARGKQVLQECVRHNEQYNAVF